MAVIPFNYTNMQNSLGMQIGLDTNNKYAQNLKDQGANLGQAFASAGEAIQGMNTNDAIRAATDENGNVDSNTLFQQLSQTNPQAALAMKQQLDKNTLANKKVDSEIMRNNAQQKAQQAVQQLNNMRIASDVLKQFNQQLANSTPETWDATVQQAKKLASHYGLDDALPDNFSEGFSPEKKQLAMNAALTYKENLDQQQQDFKNQLDSGNFFLSAANTASQISDRTASTKIQQQNADSTTLNSKTNQERLSNDKQKIQQQAIANKQKSYTADVEKFNKAKSDFIEQRNNINSNIGTLNTSLQALQQARQMLANNANLAGSSAAKFGNSWVNYFGGNNRYSNFTNLLNQGVSNQVLEIMSGQKGPQTDKDADRIQKSVVTDSLTTDPKIVLQSIDSLISKMNNTLKNKNQQLSSGLESLKTLQNAMTQKYNPSTSGQDTSNVSTDASQYDATAE